jgi:hypothetical protein
LAPYRRHTPDSRGRCPSFVLTHGAGGHLDPKPDLDPDLDPEPDPESGPPPEGVDTDG